jgi:hypothetical protein
VSLLFDVADLESTIARAVPVDEKTQKQPRDSHCVLRYRRTRHWIPS